MTSGQERTSRTTRLRRRLLSLGAGLLVVGGAFGAGYRAATPSRTVSWDVYRQARLFDRVVSKVRTDYVDSVSEAGLYTEATRQVVASLNDPYAELLLGDEFRAFNDQLAGKELGVAGGAASASRLVHASAAKHPFLLGDGVGYLELRAMTERSAGEVRDSIDRLRGSGMRALVLDLRYNPGGLIEQGVAIADLFLDAGDTIAVLKGRNPRHTRTYLAKRAQRWPDLKLAVLVGPNTASAAELLAGALQDHGRAVVVGTRTYGKGVVQTTYTLEEDAAVKLTTSRWYMPSGRSVQRPPADEVEGDTASTWGLAPDMRVGARRHTPEERDLLRALGADVALFRETLDGYAAGLVRAGLVRRPDAVVTARMRAQLYLRVRASGLWLSEETWERGRTYVDRELGYALAHAAGDAADEFRRRAADDPPLRSAVTALAEPLGAE